MRRATPAVFVAVGVGTVAWFSLLLLLVLYPPAFIVIVAAIAAAWVVYDRHYRSRVTV